jgi:hypothetical protein
MELPKAANQIFEDSKCSSKLGETRLRTFQKPYFLAFAHRPLHGGRVVVT